MYHIVTAYSGAKVILFSGKLSILFNMKLYITLWSSTEKKHDFQQHVGFISYLPYILTFTLFSKGLFLNGKSHYYTIPHVGYVSIAYSSLHEQVMATNLSSSALGVNHSKEKSCKELFKFL